MFAFKQLSMKLIAICLIISFLYGKSLTNCNLPVAAADILCSGFAVVDFMNIDLMSSN